MLKIVDDLERHLNSKLYSLCITNACNLSCGGCNQLCGLFSKEKIWFMSPHNLNQHIIEHLHAYVEDNWTRSDFSEENKYVIIYGGEPTLHPSFDAILEVLYSHSNYPFLIYTNGRTFPELYSYDSSDRQEVWKNIAAHPLKRTGYDKFRSIFESKAHTHDRNIGYRIDLKTKHTRDKFAPCLVAPADVENNYDQEYYLELAKQHCYQWKNCECAVYNDKAYACHVAAAMDHMYFEGKNGWKLDQPNCFKKNKQEIDDQLRHFCYRCGYNFGGEMAFNRKTGDRQFTNDPTIYTPLNKIDSSKNKMRGLSELPPG